MGGATNNQFLSGLRGFACGATVAAVLAVPGVARAEVNLPIFTDKFVNTFRDSSWGSPGAFGPTTNMAHTGLASYGCSFVAWEGFSASPAATLNTTLYTNLSFWAHGGTNGGQRLSVFGSVGGINLTGNASNLPALPANAWKQFIIPLAALGLANQTNCTRISWQLRNDGTTNTFHLDDLQFNGHPTPALVHLSVNATQTVRTADARWFGFNGLLYDSAFDTPSTLAALRASGWTTLRYGGSSANGYHWASNRSFDYTWEWQTSFMDFMQVATNVGGPVFIAVNYGTGTAAEAAGWVRHANITNGFGIRYWEIGNENYGLWEADSNTFPHDAYTYAIRSQDYLAQMRAADPTIRVGVVVAGEDSYVNGYTSHPATNSRNGTVHHGWTPVLLATLKSLNVTPDFLVYHYYPQGTMGESDPLLLQSSPRWATAAADLRQQISDYFGPGGTNMELLITENNSNAGDQGKQSTSLVNGLYLADSLGQVMQTEFNAFIWHALRHSGIWTNGNLDASLYGWRLYGTSGVIGANTAQTDLNTRYPAFYAAKLMRSFVAGGDTILSATSDHPWLTAYAARRASGAVNVLVINKDPGATMTAQIALTGFTSDATATICSYGIPNDEATRTNGPAAAQDISTNSLVTVGKNFTHAFTPYSLTLITLAPAPPKLHALPANQSRPDEFVFELQGQRHVRYVIQEATDLMDWTPVSTNTLTSPLLNVTNLLSPGSGPHFWRAVWQPWNE